MTPPLTLERPSDAELAKALGRTIERFGHTMDDELVARLDAGEVPTFASVAERIDVSLDDLVEVFQQEVYAATGQIIIRKGRVQ